MRKLWWILVLGAAALNGCEDSHDAKVMCSKACGHGSCYVNVTMERCQCETGYTTDADGACTVCDAGYEEQGRQCVAQSICVGKCTEPNQTCRVEGDKAVCVCELGYVDNAGVCEAVEACYSKFHYENPEAKGLKVFVTGEFDGWQHREYQLTETSDGVFDGSFLLKPGTYGYKFYVAAWGDGGWKTSGNDNGENLSVRALSCGDAVMPKLVLSGKPAVSSGNVSFSVTLDDMYELAESPEIVVKKGGQIVKSQSGKEFSFSENVGTEKKNSYVVSVKTSNDVEVNSLFVPVWNETTEFNWKDAVLYFAFIDRFNNGDTSNDGKLNITYDWQGGDFAGLKAKVEDGYFERLGVNTLWLSSVSMNTQKPLGQSCAYHSYWPVTTGYSEKTASMYANASSNGVLITPVEPHFGTMDELKSLVKACHDRGMRVLVDFAVNHVADDSPVYLQHPEWFNYVDVADRDSVLCEGPTENGKLSQKNWDRIPETCWFSDNLPDFNFEIPEVREFVVDHARWLIQETDIDGFRLDAVKHMPIQFIRDLRAGIDEMFKKTGVTFYIVGETFDGTDKIKQYIGDDLLHGQFDFPLYNSLRDTIMNGNGFFYNLKDHVLNNENVYGDALMSTFLGNHDVARAISHIHHDSEDKYGNNSEVQDGWAYHQLKLAWTFLLTTPGIPMLYYGDEYGLEGANDPDNRRMMEFEGALNELQKQTLAHVQTLGNLRQKHSAFRRGRIQVVDAYERSFMYVVSDGTESILVGISDKDEDQTYVLTDHGVSVGGNGWIDLLDETRSISETTTITLRGDRQIIIWKAK